MSRTAHILAVAIALAALAVPAVAQAASPSKIIQDCAEDGQLDRKYSNSDLRKAENRLPADLDEYSDCREVIAGAITSGSDKGRGRGGSGGGAPAGDPQKEQASRADDLAKLDELTKKREKPELSIAGQKVEPGDNGLFDLASAANALPLPLLLALIAATLLAASGGFMALKRRFPALEHIPLLNKISLPRVSLPTFRR